MGDTKRSSYRRGGSSTSGNESKTTKKKAISYAANRVVDSGSFGIVFQANVVETGETVAIKKVLQDRRYKNRELEIMQMFHHPCVVPLKHCFYSTEAKKKDVYLNLVMEYIPQTIHRALRAHAKAKKKIPLILIKTYVYQMLRSCAYFHGLGVCHRDIKPQNILLDPASHVVKMCDFGSAKILVVGEPNVAYICSRYYRAPELVFEATQYTTAVDVWSVGCVLGELLLGSPLFPGESGVEQLIEIIKILGTPTLAQIKEMNPLHAPFKLPDLPIKSWNQVFNGYASPEAASLLDQLLRYEPKRRPDAFSALSHPFFDELRAGPHVKLPHGVPLPETLFDFTPKELELMHSKGLVKKLIPAHLLEKFFPNHSNISSGISLKSSSGHSLAPSRKPDIRSRNVDALSSLSASGYQPSSSNSYSSTSSKKTSLRNTSSKPSTLPARSSQSISSYVSNPLRRAGRSTVSASSKSSATR